MPQEIFGVIVKPMEEQNTVKQTPVEQVSAVAEKVVAKLPKKKLLLPILIVAGILIVGAGTGFLLSGNKAGKLLGVASDGVPGAKVTEKEAGLADEATFKDTAEGTLEDGGVSGEGTHHLVRTGGASQNVYLTSTVINLADFVGKKVQVWGQTITARKAGWLMDVGKVKVIE